MAAERFRALVLAALILAPAVATSPATPSESSSNNRPPERSIVTRTERAGPAPGKDTGARMAALLELGRSRDRTALPTLVAALRDPDRDVRWAAIEALGDLGDRRAVPALVEYLAARRKEAYRWGKRLVANALGALGGVEAVTALTGMLEDADPFVRRCAALAILAQQDPALLARVEPTLRENPDDHLTTVKREFARVQNNRDTRVAAAPGPPGPPPPVRPHEWAGLKIGTTRTEDAIERLGAPLQRAPDSLLFRGNTVPSVVRTESVVVNTSADGVVESIFVFPVWGTLDRDVRAALGNGRLLTYGEFLRITGRTTFGAGTRVDGKLHYLPPDLLAESFQELGMLVVYDAADVAARDRIVKLLIVY